MEAADDFFVPSGEDWEVTDVLVNGCSVNTADSNPLKGCDDTVFPDFYLLTIYADDFGKPGDVVFFETSLTLSSQTSDGSQICNDLSFPIRGCLSPPDPPVLSGGASGATYWLSVRGSTFNCIDNKTWGWLGAGHIPQFGQPGIWRDEANGYGLGCNQPWDEITDCLTHTREDDRSFEILGNRISCGNGTIDSGEECDDGSANGTSASCCDSSCQLDANGASCPKLASLRRQLATEVGSQGAISAVCTDNPPAQVEAADDFFVPSEEDWEVTDVLVDGCLMDTSTGSHHAICNGFGLPPDFFVLKIYSDDGGKPGVVLFSESPLDIRDRSSDQDYGCSGGYGCGTVAGYLSPSSPPILSGGPGGTRYWVGVQGYTSNCIGTRVWGWRGSKGLAQDGLPGKWRNEQNGYGVATGCQFWSDVTYCLDPPEEDDRSFEVFGNLLSCGNGTLNVGEECDDGNVDDGDGCSGTCEVETGWACDNASPTICTDECPGAGKAVLVAKSMDDSAKDKLTIKLLKGEVPAGAAGDPTADTEYVLNLTGTGGGSYEKTLSSNAVRWVPAGSGYNYKNKSQPTDDGVKKVVVREESVPAKGNGKVIWLGKGTAAGLPMMDTFAGDVEVRLTNTVGGCLRATIPEASLRFKQLSKGQKLKGKTP